MSELERSVRVICSPELAAGFELAGITPERAEDAEQAVAKLEGLIATPDVGVVLIDDRLYRAIPESLLDDLARGPLPVIVAFPGPTPRGRPPAEEYVVELLRRAVGYRVQLR